MFICIFLDVSGLVKFFLVCLVLGFYREVGYLCFNYSIGLLFLCWLFIVFRVSKERYGKDDERIGEMENEFRK